MSTPSKILADNMRSLRLDRKWSQQTLAGKCGMSRPRISELESGSFNPTLDTVGRIAAELKVPLIRLFRLTGIRQNVR
jgi:transcriptional regulator with XRE-family HTH domain